MSDLTFACNAIPSQKTLRIDVDIELDRALRLRRFGEPVAQIGREVEGTRGNSTNKRKRCRPRTKAKGALAGTLCVQRDAPLLGAG